MPMVGASLVAWLEDCDRDSTALVGGKCSSLGELLRVPVRVPGGFAVTTEAHRRFVSENGVVEKADAVLDRVDMHDPESVRRSTSEVRRVFQAAPVPADVEATIRDTYAEFSRQCGSQELPVAVRSSATAEDLVSASFAGQLETYLWIVGSDAVLDHVVRCWSALFEPHAADYCRQLGVSFDEVLMSVAVQQMVDARSAGVMFTINPVNGDRSKIMIESAWGLGEAVVAGEVNPDRFTIDKVTFDILDRHVARKEKAHQFDPGSGRVDARPVSEGLLEAPSLTDAEVLMLAETGKAIERHYGQPQDIEWAIGHPAGTGGEAELFILQSRPETVASKVQRGPVVERRSSALDHVVSNLSTRTLRQGNGR